MDNNYWTVRREQHEVIRTLYEEDVHNYEVVVDVVRNLHNQVLEFGPIDPPRRGVQDVEKDRILHGEELRGMNA